MFGSPWLPHISESSSFFELQLQLSNCDGKGMQEPAQTCQAVAKVGKQDILQLQKSCVLCSFVRHGTKCGLCLVAERSSSP